MLMPVSNVRIALALSMVFSVSCNQKSSGDSEAADETAATATDKNVAAPMAMSEEEPAADLMVMDGETDDRAEGSMGKAGAVAPKKMKRPGSPQPARNVHGAAERGKQTRSWFPETFLFEPLVVTDDSGAAEVTVRVPDRLTSWRVLALAHSRGGAQAGATTTFLGTLPTYVELIVPPFLRAGDRVRLPVQIVNTTDAPVAGRLSLSAAGATLTGASARVVVAPKSSVLRYVELKAGRAGSARVHAAFEGADAVVRTIPVMPTGRAVHVSRSGTLAAPRTMELVGASTPGTPGTDRVRLHVYPGALAILRSELAVSLGRRGLAADAFAALLAGKASELLTSLGDQADPKALRRLSLLSAQRLVRHARRLDMTSATLLARASLAHKDNPVLSAIGNRAVRYLAVNQLPDGTCGGETGWTLQRLLVASADCARAAVGEQTVQIRASGAFERQRDTVADPYTAAAILASGAVDGELARGLREQVVAAITNRDDGSKVLTVPDGVVRADGLRPSTLEATALAVLALEGDPKAPLADLGAAILAGYSPAVGWGDGRANLVCMEAVLRLFKDPVPANTKIRLRLDGKILAEGELTRERLREVLTLEATGLDTAGTHRWSVEAIPNVPGLGFSMKLTSWVPWPSAASANGGVELQSDVPKKMRVTRPVALPIRVVAPAGQAIRIRRSLPAGVQVDSKGLDALVSAGTISSYKVTDGVVELRVPPLQAAQYFNATLRVIPTLAGTLQSGASSVTVGGVDVFLAPTSWQIDP